MNTWMSAGAVMGMIAAGLSGHAVKAESLADAMVMAYRNSPELTLSLIHI